MGEVIYLPNAMRENQLLNEQTSLTLNEVERLEAIRDNVEALPVTIAGIRRDPEAVAYGSAFRSYADVFPARPAAAMSLQIAVLIQRKCPRTYQKVDHLPTAVHSNWTVPHHATWRCRS